MLVPVTMDSSFQFFPHSPEDPRLSPPQRSQILSPHSLRALVPALRHLHRLDNTLLPAPSSDLEAPTTLLLLPPRPSGGGNGYQLGLLQLPLLPFKICSTNPYVTFSLLK